MTRRKRRKKNEILTRRKKYQEEKKEKLQMERKGERKIFRRCNGRKRTRTNTQKKSVCVRVSKRKKDEWKKGKSRKGKE